MGLLERRGDFREAARDRDETTRAAAAARDIQRFLSSVLTTFHETRGNLRSGGLILEKCARGALYYLAGEITLELLEHLQDPYFRDLFLWDAAHKDISHSNVLVHVCV